MAVSSLGDILQNLKNKAKDSSIGQKVGSSKALERLNRAAESMSKKLGLMSKQEGPKTSTNELVRKFLASKPAEDNKDKPAEDAWNDYVATELPEVLKLQMANEIAKKKENEQRLELLKQELGISKKQASTLETELGLLDSFKSFGKDPLVNTAIDIAKKSFKDDFDQKTAIFNKLYNKELSAFSKFSGMDVGQKPGIAPEKAEKEKAAPESKAPVEKVRPERPLQATIVPEEPKREIARPDKSGMEGIRDELAAICKAIKAIGTTAQPEQDVAAVQPAPEKVTPEATTDTTPVQPEPDKNAPVAQTAQDVADTAESAKDMAKKAKEALGKTPAAPLPATPAVPAVPATPAKGKGLLAGLAATLKNLPKALSSLGGVILKGLGPLGWLVTIGQAINGVIPVFSSTFGALYDVLRMAGPFLITLVMDAVTSLLSGLNLLGMAINEAIHLIPGTGDSLREKAEKSGKLGEARMKYNAMKAPAEAAGRSAAEGTYARDTTTNPIPEVKVDVAPTPVITQVEPEVTVPAVTREETPVTTPEEERSYRERPAPAPVQDRRPAQEQNAVLEALKRISAPQNPGTTPVFVSNPYLAPFTI